VRTHWVRRSQPPCGIPRAHVAARPGGIAIAELSQILSAFGLSASAGLNAYIPLLIIALTTRLFPQYLQLNEPYDLLASNLSIAVLVVLLLVEVAADKVPVVDHINDIISVFIRPTAGAVLFAASTSSPTVAVLDPRLALILGFLVAGATHSAKATARPVVTASTGGVGNPVVSTIEDVAALLTSLVAVLAPLLIGVSIIIFVLLIWWWWARRRARPATVG